MYTLGIAYCPGQVYLIITITNYRDHEHSWWESVLAIDDGLYATELATDRHIRYCKCIDSEALEDVHL